MRTIPAFLLSLLILAPAARAQSVSPADFAAQLTLLRAAALLSVRAQKPGPSLTPAQAHAKIEADLVGSGVPASYADAVFADPRARIYPQIPGYFGGGSATAEIPYDQYQKYVLTASRISMGAQFVRDHRALLAQVEARTGVDGTLLTALAGVETLYGTNTGRFQVIDALDTIVQKVPRLSDWAAREAAAFLEMTYAQGLDAHAVLGSYAGAFGYVQFEPSSYQRFAVDFDGDGSKRLDQWPDALGSAAHYLVLAGYRTGAPFTPDSPIGRSLFAYNHSDNYVRGILDLRAAILQRLP
ncbi:MAG: lytic murein transglycosylase [Elusimicrobia bacterium]|nr:lytic murein transglycosylase [Elusimicrobiota bacterium]